MPLANFRISRKSNLWCTSKKKPFKKVPLSDKLRQQQHRCLAALIQLRDRVELWLKTSQSHFIATTESCQNVFSHSWRLINNTELLLSTPICNRNKKTEVSKRSNSRMLLTKVAVADATLWCVFIQRAVFFFDYLLFWWIAIWWRVVWGDLSWWFLWVQAIVLMSGVVSIKFLA